MDLAVNGSFDRGADGTNTLYKSRRQLIWTVFIPDVCLVCLLLQPHKGNLTSKLVLIRSATSFAAAVCTTYPTRIIAVQLGLDPFST
ncbi:hypothetical protein M422DRAFT_35444 [Sphaerobolus stellatus SS14]|uniref:Uncharacterized protein n=1 Tax=Sphaerobolus stellatus (strain SS14) TaxID=990650 RepID=A0A0C9UFH9_SPHS4|nr:hypothetical protein M422DRAFT_35444 [Sphaerobolus stellatus SS14]